jgi:hypothetical protein
LFRKTQSIKYVGKLFLYLIITFNRQDKNKPLTTGCALLTEIDVGFGGKGGGISIGMGIFKKSQQTMVDR